MRYLYTLCHLGGFFWLTILAPNVVAQANSSAAQPSPPRASLALFASAPIEVTVASEPTGSVLRVGKLNIPVSIRDPSGLQAEVVQLKGGARIGVLRLTAANDSAAALVVRRPNGALESLWTGHTQFAGDPGERHADALEVGDRDGDGSADIVVGSYDEPVRVCGEDRTLLAPRAVDPKTLTLRSVLLNRAAHRPVTAQLVASTTHPISDQPPLLRALRASGASSSSPDASQSAAALTDADLSTSWVEGRGLGGRFEFATLRWNASSRPIVALAVVPLPPAAAPPAAPKPAERARVRVLSLLGPGGEHLTATLPEDPKPGQRYWITPSEPLAWSCLTVSIDDVFTDKLTPQTHTGLAEIEAYTDLDRTGGLSQLVTDLALPGTRGDDATALLAHASGDVVSALIETWPRLPALGKRRALRLLFSHPASVDTRTRDVLRSALRDQDQEISAQALRIASERALPFGPALLEDLAHSATRQGDAAAQVIAHSGAPNALDALLAVLLAPNGSDRAPLREALAVAYQARGPAASETIKAWSASEPAKPVAARAALVLALSRVPEARAEATALATALVAEAHDFADQWRLVQATMTLPSEPIADAWLDDLAQSAEAWMLRVAAIDSLSQRGSSLAAAAAKRALGDDYPRVRAVGVRVLAPDPTQFAGLAKLAQEDKWFLVRQAALEKLPDTAQARQLFVTSLKDKAATVRASAVQALQRVDAASAWPAVKPLLENAEEYPEVIAAGVAYARGLCVHDAVPSLKAVVKRGMQPEAWSADQELALAALEALSDFGGDAAAWARDHAVGPLVPKEVHVAAAEAAKRPANCRVRTTL
jgi:hypothetical protein